MGYYEGTPIIQPMKIDLISANMELNTYYFTYTYYFEISTTHKLLFEWSHTRVTPTDSKFRNALFRINSTT